MSKQSVFFVGATGETGVAILDALLEDGSFDITCFIRTSSADKPVVQDLRDRGLKVVIGDLDQPKSSLSNLLRGIDTVISIVFPGRLRDQIPLIDAAAEVGVKRFVPCNWATPVARGGIMPFHDGKEEIHDHIFRLRLGYTIIDVGYWYQTTEPRLPSGRFDYGLAIPNDEVFAGGTARNMLIHKADLGRVTARIIKDDRTLNKKVYACGEVLSQNEINALVEEKSGEKLQLTERSAEQVMETLKEAKAAAEADPDNVELLHLHVSAQYNVTKYVREDNTPENAEYLGYIDGRALYPDLKYISYAGYIDELLSGKATKVYPHIKFF